MRDTLKLPAWGLRPSALLLGGGLCMRGISDGDGGGCRRGLEIKGWWFPPSRPGRFKKRGSEGHPQSPGKGGRPPLHSSCGGGLMRKEVLVGEGVCHVDGLGCRKGLEIKGWWFPPSRPGRFKKRGSEGHPQSPGIGGRPPLHSSCGGGLVRKEVLVGKGVCHVDGLGCRKGLEIKGWWFPPSRPGRLLKT